MRESLSMLRSSLILMVVSSIGFILLVGKELAILRELALGDLGQSLLEDRPGLVITDRFQGSWGRPRLENPFNGFAVIGLIA